SKNTIKTMKVALSFLQRFLDKKGWKNLCFNVIPPKMSFEMRDYALSEGLTLNSFNGYMRDIKNFCNCAIKDRITNEIEVQPLLSYKASVKPLVNIPDHTTPPFHSKVHQSFRSKVHH